MNSKINQMINNGREIGWMEENTWFTIKNNPKFDNGYGTTYSKDITFGPTNESELFCRYIPDNEEYMHTVKITDLEANKIVTAWK